MKNYRERAERVLARRDAKLEEKRKRKKILLRYAVTASSVCGLWVWGRMLCGTC